MPGKEAQVEKGGDSVKLELTTPARLFIKCAQETGEIFGPAYLIRVLRGSRSKKVLKFKHEKLSSYGAGRNYSEEHWRQLAGQFVRRGLLERTQPHGSLKVTAIGDAVLKGGEFWGALPGVAARVVRKSMPEYDPVLFERLRALRASLASERDLPAFVIFHDRTLIEMATYFPHTPDELGKIYGVGQRKVFEYGPHFLPVIQAYCRENQIQPVPKPAYGTPRSSSGSAQLRTDNIWKRFQSGESIADIAADMDFTQSTILYHLQKAFEAGKPLREDALKEAGQLSPRDEQQVMVAFEELGDTYLKPVFEALEGSVDYDQLRLWRLIFQIRSASRAAG